MGKVIRRGEEARQKVIEIVKNGGTWNDAMDATGYGYSYVRQLCAKHGLYTPRKYVKPDPELLKKLVEDGCTMERIIEECGYSDSMCVRNACKLLGLPYPKTELWYRQHQERIVVHKAQPLFHICPICQKVFVSSKQNIIYCSKGCEKKHNSQVNDIKRKRLEKAQQVDDITLDEVYRKYNGICYLCGGKCDYSAVRMVNGVPKALGDYPSREHVIPISKGGLHSWENVRLAHIKCNSSKGARYG